VIKQNDFIKKGLRLKNQQSYPLHNDSQRNKMNDVLCEEYQNVINASLT